MFLTLLCGLLILLVIWDYFNKKHRNDVLRRQNINGPTALPLVGSLFHMPNTGDEQIVEDLRRLALENGKFQRFWMAGMLSIFCSHAKVLEDLLSSQELITKNFVYNLLRTWLGNGMLMSAGKRWYARRKIITPTFHFKILEQFVEVFDQQSNVLIEKLKAHADGKTTVDVYPLLGLMALDIIAETAMGVKVDAQHNPEVGYVANVRTVTHLTAERIRKALWRSEFTFKLFAPKAYKSYIDNIEASRRFTTDIIEKRRALLEKTLKETSYEKSQEQQEDEDIGRKRRMALLDVLLQANIDGKPLSNTDIMEEVDTFMFAGHDTTTSGSAFALHLIARDAEVQQKLFDEIRTVMGDDKDKPATYQELQELKYLECVIKEALRLFPPVPIIGRYFEDDVQLGGYTIPGKTHINVPIFIVLRDPDYFENPNDFKPERFMPENIDKIMPFAYIPFSAGPRNCVGQKFAMFEMKSTISKVLRHYELVPLGENVRPMISLVLRSVNGMQIGLKPRIYN